MEKIKVLFWGDYCCSTGFSTVSSNIWKRLIQTGKYDLDVVGINYSGDPYDREKFPGNVYTAISALNLQPPYNEPFGRQKLLDIISHNDYDVVFLLQDTFIVQSITSQIEELQRAKFSKPFSTIYYFPIDSTPKEDWIKEAVSKMNYPVAYTNYGYNECIKIDPTLKDRLNIIYHGNDFDNFYYIEDRKEVASFRNTAFRGEADGKFLILNVNRNQRRKDIPRSLMILKEMKERGHHDSILYLHMAAEDVGGNIFDMASAMGLTLGKDYLLPQNFSPHEGFSVEVLNLVYNSADAFLTTTHGEGWGLSVTEAMATRTPIVAPNNTSLTEMLADNRAFLVDSGADPSMWIIKDQDNDRLRPLMDVEQAADRLIDIKNGILPDIDQAHQWIYSYSWDNIARQWEGLIDEAYSSRNNIKTLMKTSIINAPEYSSVLALNRKERRKNRTKK